MDQCLGIRHTKVIDSNGNLMALPLSVLLGNTSKHSSDTKCSWDGIFLHDDSSVTELLFPCEPPIKSVNKSADILIHAFICVLTYSGELSEK